MIAHSSPRPTTAPEAVPDDGSCTTADLGETLLGATDTVSHLHANMDVIRELDNVPHTFPCLTRILWISDCGAIYADHSEYVQTLFP